jgi:hypothetical protein
MLALGDEPLEICFRRRDRVRPRYADHVETVLLGEFAQRRRDVERL